MAGNIGACQTNHEWHPDIVMTWRKYVLEVDRLVLAQPDSLVIEGFINWVLIIFTRVEVDNIQPGSSFSEGEADQFAPDEMHVGDETIPCSSSHLGHLSSFLNLQSVGALKSHEGHSVSGQLIEF
jgi:hypothetical protein